MKDLTIQSEVVIFEFDESIHYSNWKSASVLLDSVLLDS